MIDENAYGILISYFGIEDDEYALEREQFLERFQHFCACWQSFLEQKPLASSVLAVDLGHALYLEFAEDELLGDPLSFLRELRNGLRETELESVGVLTFGGRWLLEDNQSQAGATRRIGSVNVQQLSRPSEPMRHALDADAAARMTSGDELSGWGPGLYVEDEAIEALGRKLKNAPTSLEAGGAIFYRIGS
jgi:hypothetical protein